MLLPLGQTGLRHAVNIGHVAQVAQEHLQAAALAAWEAFLGEFALHYAPFRAAVMALASLDALHSLATLACNTG